MLTYYLNSSNIKKNWPQASKTSNRKKFPSLALIYPRKLVILKKFTFILEKFNP